MSLRLEKSQFTSYLPAEEVGKIGKLEIHRAIVDTGKRFNPTFPVVGVNSQYS